MMDLMAGLLDCFQPERFFHSSRQESSLVYRPETPGELAAARGLMEFYNGYSDHPELCLSNQEAIDLTAYIFESLNPYGENKSASRSNAKTKNCMEELTGMPKPIAYWSAHHILETQRSWPVLMDIQEARKKAIAAQHGMIAQTDRGATKLDAIRWYEQEIKHERREAQSDRFGYTPTVKIGVYETWDKKYSEMAGEAILLS